MHKHVIQAHKGYTTATELIMKCKDICLVSIKQKYPHARIILGGDFNCPGIDWEHGSVSNRLSNKVYTLLHKYLQESSINLEF